MSELSTFRRGHSAASAYSAFSCRLSPPMNDNNFLKALAIKNSRSGLRWQGGRILLVGRDFLFVCFFDFFWKTCPFAPVSPPWPSPCPPPAPATQKAAKHAPIWRPRAIKNAAKSASLTD